MGKTYTGTGKSHFGNETYMHYPPINRGKHKEAVVLNHVEWTHSEITIEQLEKFIEMETRPFLLTLPSTWYVVVTQENIDVLGKWKFEDYKFPSLLKIGNIVGMIDKSKEWGINKNSIKDYYEAIEITFDEFRFHVLKQYNKQDWIEGRIGIKVGEWKNSLLDSFMKECNPNNSVVRNPTSPILYARPKDYYHGEGHWESDKVRPNTVVLTIEELLKTDIMSSNNEQELIGYNLKYPEREAVVRKALNYSSKHTPFFIKGHIDGCYPKMCKDLGIWEWFEPVYKAKEPELPNINGYSGKIEGNQIVYGSCGKLHKDWFKSSETRYIKEMVLSSGVKINQEDMEKIRKVINYHEQN
ncbi:MAG: hypothetical protein E6Q36_08295 [Chryseobacterium sp.]|nr:MAG: hypothetical protein E6Q36_08295 [Chryseobacterium sp.]